MEEPTPRPSRRKLAAGIGLALLIILLVASASYYQLVLVPATGTQPAATSTLTPTPTPTPTQTPTLTPSPTPVAPSAGEVVKITMEITDSGAEWAFTVDGELNPTIRVKVGDTVELTLVNTGQTVHDITIPFFAVGAEKTFIAPGESVTTSFVANSPGTFEYFCAQPGHEQLGMKGSIIVE